MSESRFRYVPLIPNIPHMINRPTGRRICLALYDPKCDTYTELNTVQNLILKSHFFAEYHRVLVTIAYILGVDNIQRVGRDLIHQMVDWASDTDYISLIRHYDMWSQCTTHLREIVKVKNPNGCELDYACTFGLSCYMSLSNDRCDIYASDYRHQSQHATHHTVKNRCKKVFQKSINYDNIKEEYYHWLEIRDALYKDKLQGGTCDIGFNLACYHVGRLSACFHAEYRNFIIASQSPESGGRIKVSPIFEEIESLPLLYEDKRIVVMEKKCKKRKMK